MRASLIQFNATDDVDANLRCAERLIRASKTSFDARLYILPEYAHFVGATRERKITVAETVPDGKACRFFSALAKELGAAIHCGTIVERCNGALYNTSVVFGPDGAELCRYRKIHLIDAELPSGRVVYESHSFSAGTATVTFCIDGVTFGCAICYDFRFPELFRDLRLQGTDIIIFVTASTREKEMQHFDVLPRARAIETQSYVVVVDQCGTFFDGALQFHGNSMVIDPWGKVEEKLGDDAGFLNCTLDLSKVRECRRRMPLLEGIRGPSFVPRLDLADRLG